MPAAPSPSFRMLRGPAVDHDLEKGLVPRRSAYAFPCGGVEVVRANRSYTLYSRRTDDPVAHLCLTSDGDKVQVIWRQGAGWAAPGDFGSVVMPLDQAVQFIAIEGFFWINA
jgi:hypothetical protein